MMHVPGTSAKSLRTGIICCAVLFFLYLLFTISLRLSPEAINTKFTVKLDGPSTELYVRVPYGDYQFSYREGPYFTGVYGAFPPQILPVKCRTIIEKEGKIMLDTDKYQFVWLDHSKGTHAVKVTSNITNSNKAVVFLNISPGF